MSEPAARPPLAPGGESEAPLYNSRITSTYLKLLRLRSPQVDVGEILRHAGMEPHQIADEGH